MQRTYHILTAEIVLTSFIGTILFPSHITFAEENIDTSSGAIITQENMPLADTGNTNTGTSDIGNTNTGNTDTGSLDTGISNTIFASGVSLNTESGAIILEPFSYTGEYSSGIISSTTQKDIIPINTPLDINTGSVTSTGTIENLIENEKKKELLGTNEHPEEQILVQFKSNIDSYVGQYQVDEIENTHNLDTKETIIEQNIAIMEIQNTPSINPSSFAEGSGNINIIKAEEIEEKIQELRQDPRIEHVQRNFVYQTQSIEDTDFPKLWGLDNQGQSIDEMSGIPDADIDYPEAMNYASGKLGTGVIVAVLDTGVAYNHPDLAGHMWNGSNCVSDTGSSLGGCIHGYDFAYDDLDPMDGYYHGTHVAGTIGAITSNGTGTTGVAPNVTIMAVKVLGDTGGGTTADIIRGINFATKNGAKIINASLGIMKNTNRESDFDYLMYEAIKKFPGLFVASAGNSGIDTDGTTKSFPAGFGSNTTVSGEIVVDREMVVSGEITIPGLQNVISVGATDQNDNIAYFSNHGINSVHIAAPGTNIYSTIPVSETISGEVSNISTDTTWNKQIGASSGSWTNRVDMNIIGNAIGLSGAIWTDTNTPYVSGENSYIEKSFVDTNLHGKSQTIKLNLWCDTPSSNYYSDYLEVLVSTGGVYKSIGRIDEDILNYDVSTETVIINGHSGSYGQYQANINNLDPQGKLDVRLRWHTDAIDDTENGIPHYGCAVQDVAIDTFHETYGYKYLAGTSMASPHVAGAAALAWSYKPDASVSDVRNAILWGGDFKPQLGEYIQNGRRLNIENMLKALEIPSLMNHGVVLSGESTAVVNYTSDIPTWGVVLYSTGINDRLLPRRK